MGLFIIHSFFVVQFYLYAGGLDQHKLFSALVSAFFGLGIQNCECETLFHGFDSFIIIALMTFKLMASGRKLSNCTLPVTQDLRKTLVVDPVINYCHLKNFF